MSETQKGTRGFDLDLHVTFIRPLPRAEALSALLALEGFRVDLYQPHPQALRRTDAGSVDPQGDVPSARLTGPLGDPELVRSGLRALLGGPARTVEVGLRGYLRSAEGQTEWMPWRKNAVLARADVERVAFAEGVRYVLE